MRTGFRDFTRVCATLAVFSGASIASAQPAPTPAPTPPPAPAQPAPPPPAEPAAPAPTAPAEPAEPPAQPVAEPAPEESAPAPVVEPQEEPPPPPPETTIQLEPPPETPVPPPEEPAPPGWYEKLHVGAFVDGYYSLNFHTPKPQSGRNRFRAYDTTNGFALSWAGIDVAFDGEQFGGTLGLRFGPTAGAVAGDDASAGLENIKQAYATWRPGGADGGFTLDFGKFDTIYGAEVAESHLNYNYTRGLVNWLAQPVFHTGLRATVEFSPQFWMTGLLVNGWNNSIDNNAMKSFGLQLSTSMPNASDPEGPPLLDAHIGYLGGPEQVDFGLVACPAGTTFDPDAPDCNTNNPENSELIVRDAGEANGPDGFRHLIDLIVGLSPSRQLSLLLNADVGFEGVREGSLADEGLSGFSNQLWWGVALMGRYQFDHSWAAALRGEIYGDPDARATADGDPYRTGVTDLSLYSATLTLEYVPVANLILRLDNRLDLANEDVYPQQLRSYGSLQGTSTLGVVVTTD